MERSLNPAGDVRLSFRGGVAHLFALSAFAVAQPIFSVFRGSPEFFIGRRSRPEDLIGLALILLLAPAAVAAAWVGVGWRIRRRLGELLLAAAAGGFFGLIVLAPVSRFTTLAWQVAAIMAALAGTAFGYSYLRLPAVRQLATFAVVAPFAFAVLFLLTPPLSRFVFQPAIPSAPAAAGGDRPPIVMIVMDEFPAAALLDSEGRIDRTRFPNFASLAGKAHWFPNVFSVSDSTNWAVPAILSGLEPVEGKLPSAADYPRSLFTLLRGEYEMHVEETFTDVCPDQVCGARSEAAYPSRIRTLLEVSELIYRRVLLLERYRQAALNDRDLFAVFLHVANARAESAVDRRAEFREFMAGIQPGVGRLHFLHTFLPHGPFEYLPSGRVYPDPGLPGRPQEVWRHEWLATQGQQRLLLQLQMVDGLIGELIAHLERSSMYDESLVVLTADHGLAAVVGEHDRRFSARTAGYIAPVPLFIKTPGQRRGSVHPGAFRTIDILPAVAEEVGVEIPWKVDGVSALSGRPRSPNSLEILAIRRPIEVLNIDSPLQAMQKASDQILSRFGEGRPRLDLFAFGPHGELAGSRARAAGASGIRARLDPPGTSLDVTRGSNSIPAYVHGRVEGRARFIAVALNGIVATVVPTYDLGTGVEFGAMLPEQMLRPGRTRVDLYSVEGAGRRRRLLALSVS